MTDIYYIMAEAVPAKGSAESKEFGGAYINIWVRAQTTDEALIAAKAHIAREGWELVNIEEVFVPDRNGYTEQESLDCYDEACREGLSSVFYTYPLHEGYYS